MARPQNTSGPTSPANVKKPRNSKKTKEQLAEAAKKKAEVDAVKKAAAEAKKKAAEEEKRRGDEAARKKIEYVPIHCVVSVTAIVVDNDTHHVCNSWHIRKQGLCYNRRNLSTIP